MGEMPSYGALLAAYYKVQDPTLTQRDIAERANLGNQAQVSRFLAEAREKEVLREVFQFPADMLTSWGIEMEVLILGWYILTETGSVLLPPLVY